MAGATAWPVVNIPPQTGVRGDLEAEYRKMNDNYLRKDGRLLSTYTVPGGRVLVITEAERSATIILLPEEY